MHIPAAAISTPLRKLNDRFEKLGIGIRRSPMISKFAERPSSSNKGDFDTLTLSRLVKTIALFERSSIKYVI